ncbi:hypothetical protein SLEP1_g3827 [Rubroshorea leprosula]|uniref:Uncharacterized protein n=1 Tax=Rubroshorea leprosula TaxID=152421 RepID=A0AAV5HSH8_9ROSI|nr:hypothetical protein SLEP1_g3827 [Rubroshorea leprosula]
MKGASCLIKHLHAKGIPFALATGSHRRHFELKTKRHGELFKLMHHIVLGDDPEDKKGKPAPDVSLAAAGRFERLKMSKRILSEHVHFHSFNSFNSPA